MAWFGHSKLDCAVTALQHDMAELRDSAHRQEQRLSEFATHLSELADRCARANAAAERLDEAISTVMDRLGSIEEATERDQDALEKARLSLVRIDLQMRSSAEEAEKTVAALLDRIETYRVNMKAA